MAALLRLAVRILDHEPFRIPDAGSSSHQVWIGGATDLLSRHMIAVPARWLVLADYDASRPAPEDTNCLLAWDLEQILPGDERSPAAAGGVILVSMDVDPEHEEEFNAWYNTEHIPRLRGISGVIAARRFRARTGPQPAAPAYVALYHVENTDIYADRTWVTANETPWMLRMRRFQRNRMYFMFRTRVV